MPSRQWEMLYKTGSNGKELQWTIATQPLDGSQFVDIVTTHGQVGGALQESRVTITQGKNLGRSNATTPQEQAELEAEAKWLKQIDKCYSVERGGGSKEHKPMLAHKYRDHQDKVVFGNDSYMQPKLDGQRCIAKRVNGSVSLTSRGGKPIKGLEHIRQSLLEIMKEGDVLDGELYSHSLEFQQMMSLIKKPCEESLAIQYHIYDVVRVGGFAERFFGFVASCSSRRDHLRFVETYIASSHEDVSKWHDKFVADGYEGGMLRHGGCPYREGAKSHHLLKVKSFLDEEFVVVDVVPCDRSPTHANFVCKMNGNGATFHVTPEGSHEMRERYLLDRDLLIGKMLTVRYFELTTSEKPVPRFPVGVGIRESGE